MSLSLRHTIMISSLWLLLGFALYCSIAVIIISLNMFSWTPEQKQPALISAFFVFVILIGIFFLSRYTKNKFERWFSFLVVCGLALMGGLILADAYNNETVSFLRSQPSPHWFTISTSGVFFIPILLHMYFINVFKKPKK